MLLIKLLCLGCLIALIARLGGWRSPLPHWVVDLLSIRKPAGHGTFESDSDSGDSDSGEEVIEHAGGALLATTGRPTTPVTGHAQPGLAERITSRLERWAGEPEVVHETPMPEPTDREQQRAALVEHLQRERARPGLTATAIVRSAARQADVPWGDVSEATVWRAWRSLP